MEGVRCPACPASSIRAPMLTEPGDPAASAHGCTQLGRPGNTRTKSQSRKFLIMDTTMPCHLRHLAFRAEPCRAPSPSIPMEHTSMGSIVSWSGRNKNWPRFSRRCPFRPFFPSCTPTKRAWVPLEGRVMVGNMPCAGQRIICRGCR